MSSTNNVSNNKNTTVNMNMFQAGLKKTQLKSDAQKSIFDMIDKNKNGVIDNNETNGTEQGTVKNKEGKSVKQDYVKLKDLENGRKLVVGKDGKEHVMSHDGVILSDSYLKQQSEKKADNKKSKPQTTALSKEKNQSLNNIIKSHNAAQKAFDKQMADDGWAGDVADGVSALWNSDNRATKVRADLKASKENISQLKDAAKQGDAQFNKKFKEIYGVDYNQKAMEAYQKNPTEENYQNAFGKKQQNITSRVENYNQSQKTGAMAVKTTAKIGAGVAVGIATGGTGFVAMGAAAVGTAAASAAIEETDRLKVGDAVTKGKIEFREGTNHGQILKDAAFDGAAVLAGGAVAKGAGAIVQGTKAATAAGQTAATLTKGQKVAKAGLTMTGDVATGAVQEKLQTGDVTLEGTLMNAAMSGVGSVAESGVLKKGYQAAKKAFGKTQDNIPNPTTHSSNTQSSSKTENAAATTKTDTPQASATNTTTQSGKKEYIKPEMKETSIAPKEDLLSAPDPDADLERFANMGDLIARGTNDVPKQGFFSKLFGKKQTAETTNINTNNANAKRAEIKKLDPNVDLNNIAASGVKDGGIFTQNNQLYIRNGNEATKLNLSQSTYERLFPHEQMQFNQAPGANSCWFLSSVDAAFDSPSGKASMLKMFSEDAQGNIRVKLYNTSDTFVFPNGKPMKGIKHGVRGDDGIAMLEQSMAAKYDINASKKYANYATNEFSINSFSPDALDSQICTKQTAHDAITLLGGRFNFDKNVQANVDKEKFKNNLKAAANDPNSFPSIASYAHQRVVKGVETIGGTDYVTISDPYTAGNYEKVKLDDLIQRDAPTLAVYSFPTKASAKSNNSGITSNSSDYSPTSSSQPRPTSPKSEVQTPQTSEPITPQQPKKRFVIGEQQTPQATSQQTTRAASSENAPTSSMQPQKARISSANLKEIGTVNGQPIMARYVERIGDIFTVEVNGKQYQIASGQNVKLSDNVSLKCGKYGVTAEINQNTTPQRASNSGYTETSSRNAAPSTTTPRTSNNLAMPAGYREYGKVMGKRAIINSDNVVMYEANGRWKRAN